MKSHTHHLFSLFILHSMPLIGWFSRKGGEIPMWVLLGRACGFIIGGKIQGRDEGVVVRDTNLHLFGNGSGGEHAASLLHLLASNPAVRSIFGVMGRRIEPRSSFLCFCTMVFFFIILFCSCSWLFLKSLILVLLG